MKTPSISNANSHEWAPVATVAKIVGIPRTTIISAMERGEIEPTRLHGDYPVVHIPSVQAWAKIERPVGRPRLSE